MFVWILVSLQFCQDEADDYYWCLLGGGGEDPENHFFSAYNSEYPGKATHGSEIVEYKVQVEELSRL